MVGETLIDIKYAITHSLIRAETVLANGGDANSELAALQAILMPWIKMKKKRLAALDRLEKEAISLRLLAEWPRPKRPKWQLRCLSLLTEIAKDERLLDWERSGGYK